MNLQTIADFALKRGLAAIAHHRASGSRLALVRASFWNLIRETCRPMAAQQGGRNG